MASFLASTDDVLLGVDDVILGVDDVLLGVRVRIRLLLRLVFLGVDWRTLRLRFPRSSIDATEILKKNHQRSEQIARTWLVDPESLPKSSPVPPRKNVHRRGVGRDGTRARAGREHGDRSAGQRGQQRQQRGTHHHLEHWGRARLRAKDLLMEVCNVGASDDNQIKRQLAKKNKELCGQLIATPKIGSELQ